MRRTIGEGDTWGWGLRGGGRADPPGTSTPYLSTGHSDGVATYPMSAPDFACFAYFAYLAFFAYFAYFA
eukprot:77126-Rhodomonas_salina.3